jgi:hypothetical protein
VSGRCRNNKRFLNVVNRKAIDTREVIFPRAVPYYALRCRLGRTRHSIAHLGDSCMGAALSCSGAGADLSSREGVNAVYLGPSMPIERNSVERLTT